jgi:G3E family GTPase
MSKIPFILVTGFLGSGKTTFLKKALKKYHDKKIAIVQNEFAPANIDGIELKNEAGDFQILEINNGSVFCVCLLNNFITSLRAFVEKHQPDVVIMEASGLSDPIAIAQMFDTQALSERLFLARVWTIVDGFAFFKYQHLMTRIRHQVRVADIIVINKTDLATDEELVLIERNLRDLNPFCNIVKSQFCDLPKTVFEMDLLSEVMAKKADVQNSGFESSGKPDIKVGVLRTTKAIGKVELEHFIDNYSKNTIRMKGFVKLKDGAHLALQSSFGKYDLREVKNYLGPTEIIAMGDQFNLSEFSRKFRTLAE